jgi:hypothetical protein
MDGRVSIKIFAYTGGQMTPDPFLIIDEIIAIENSLAQNRKW